MNGKDEYEVENRASVDVADGKAIEKKPQEFLSVAPDRLNEALLKIENVSQILDKSIRIALRRTKPQDWVRMGSKYYLMASGVEKIRGVFGLYFRDRVIVREDFPDGTYSYICSGIAGSKLLDGLFGEGITIDIEGARSSQDDFYSSNNRSPDPMDVRKSAYANFIVRSAKTILGLGNYTEADLKEMGVNVGKVAKVDYKEGAEGGGKKEFISQAQQKRLFAIANANSVSENMLKTYLTLHHKVDSTSQIKKGEQYDKICLWAERGGVEGEAAKEPGEEG